MIYNKQISCSAHKWGKLSPNSSMATITLVISITLYIFAVPLKIIEIRAENLFTLPTAARRLQFARSPPLHTHSPACVLLIAFWF